MAALIMLNDEVILLVNLTGSTRHVGIASLALDQAIYHRARQNLQLEIVAVIRVSASQRKVSERMLVL